MTVEWTTGRATAAPTGCPARDRGLELRNLCGSCDGRPRQGQLRLPRRGMLHLQGETADTVFLVIEGTLCETRTTEEGRAQGMRLLGPGDVTGTEALVSGRYQCSVEALTPARVCRVPIAEAEARLATTSLQGVALCRALAVEMMGLRERIMVLGPMPAQERVETALRAMAGDDGEWVRLPLNRRELGELLALTQETVSRCVQRLKRAGTLQTQGRRIRFLARA
ncbi:MAG: Crp/Fnr family transcriptional regulator [Myxococcota bacterium]